MFFIRSFIFNIAICLAGIIVPILYSKAIFTKDSALADKGAKVWARFSLFALEKLCNIKYEIRGLENLPKENGFVIACKHQSMWETIVFHIIFDSPVYSWKKELLKIPFYGWYLKVMSGITIDRSGGAKSLKNLLGEAQKYANLKQNIILFPQGTRTPKNAKTANYPYQSGVAAIYNHLKVDVVPAALNSGEYWNKNGNRKSGTIILEFLPIIKAGLNRKDFMQKLETAIEDRSNSIS
ncbi:MAG: 1-acyl-sn-glycerol-3-phosphate acyltransferase [Rickettsiales bacterium]|jgi:1-acyl-sn-glycerol-3-phosphate acyltransferase